MSDEALLKVENLRLDLVVGSRRFGAVKDVSFSIGRGETFGLVGESGCGKSITALALIGLLRRPLAFGGGRILFKGREIQDLPGSEMRKLRQMMVHILPNAIGPVIVAATIEVSSAIIAESTLSFLGLGFPPDIPTWGRLLFDAKDQLDTAPHWALFPGAALFLTVLSINFIGDGLRDALDPRRVI